MNNYLNKPGATKYILIFILIVAFVIRVWGSSFGLPYNYHFDEQFYVNTALALGDGVLNNPPYNPTGLSNILFPQFAAYYLVGKIIGEFSSPQVFEAVFRTDPTIFYLLARLTVIVFGAATILALFLLGRASSNSKVGLLAAGFLAVNFLSVRDSHYSVPDIPMVFFVVLAVGLAANGLRHTRRWNIYLAGLAGGLAVAMKWTGFPVIAAVMWASVSLEHKVHSGIIGKLVNRTVIVSLLAFVIGFALSSPQILINPTPYVELALNLSQVGNGDNLSLTSSAVLNKWLFYGESLYYGGGIILIPLGIVGVMRRLKLAVKARDPMSILLLSFPLFYVIIIIAVTNNRFIRYVLPLVPFLALFGAEAILVLWTRLRQVRWGRPLVILMVLAAIVLPLTNSIQHDLILTREDTRTLANEWIEASIPEGSEIAVDWLVHGPPLSSLEQIVPHSDRVYDVHVIGGSGLSDQTVAWYKDQGIDYMIASSFIYMWWTENLYPERHAFYNSLGDYFTLVQTFRSHEGDSEPPYIFDEIYGPVISLWQRVRPGPTLKIYRIQSGGNQAP